MINFFKYKWLYGLISAVAILIGLYSIVRWGYAFSIDFVGGSIIEYKFDKKLDAGSIRPVLQKEKVKVFSLTKKDRRQYLIKTAPLDEKRESRLRKKLEATLKVKAETLRFETVGPTLGRETQTKTIIAAAVAVLGILIYLSFTFANLKFGLAAIAALIHDFLVVLGVYSLLSHFWGAEVDSLFVTAILTTMSFSVHDTIVIFGKIKEYRSLDRSRPFDLLVNRALTTTIVRSLNNSLTIILMLLALILLGGDTTRFFVITLLVGTITGTYSSPFVAAPILEMMEKKR